MLIGFEREELARLLVPQEVAQVLIHAARRALDKDVRWDEIRPGRRNLSQETMLILKVHITLGKDGKRPVLLSITQKLSTDLET